MSTVRPYSHTVLGAEFELAHQGAGADEGAVPVVIAQVLGAFPDPVDVDYTSRCCTGCQRRVIAIASKTTNNFFIP